jgi:hypothetical protein
MGLDLIHGPGSKFHLAGYFGEIFGRKLRNLSAAKAL